MAARAGVPAISKPVLAFFRRIVRGYFRRSFHGVRVRGAERFTEASGPLIVYANHGSWWDPMVATLLAEKLLPGRSHYAPMDAEALARYGILRWVGIFGVEMETGRGAVQFLRTGEAVLKAGGVLWITPQGRFVDARARPLGFKPGMAALAARAGAGCTVLPLAIEYTFWDERMPECLLQFGEAVRLSGEEIVNDLNDTLNEALVRAMDELKMHAMARESGRFVTLLRGGVGTGGFYALGQRVKALIERRRYRATHGTGSD